MNAPQPGPPKQQPPWPKLREELIICRGPSGLFGAPSWTLEDPAAHRFYRLGWLEFEVISRWDLGEPEKIIAAVSAESALAITEAEVEKVLNFLTANNLIQTRGLGDIARLAQQKERQKVSWVKTAMKSYLFFRIPLVKPDGFLNRTYPLVRHLFSRRFGLFLAGAAFLAFYLIARQWATFSDSLAALGTWEGWAMVGLTLMVSKVIHELGHGYAAKKMNLPVPAMGVALMCFSPVMWTDTTAAWRVNKTADRLLIGLSGVLAEIILATAASWAWLVLPPGPLRTAAFITASTTWVMTLMVNANPLMRYDAYYLLSDLWEAPSLQTRSFALARWHLRKLLFGLPDAVPEHLPQVWRMRFIIYAWACWIYRFFLFLGIAVLVYHLFFKLLGIILFLIEIAFFVAVPILKEFEVWWKRRKEIWAIPKGRAASIIMGILLLLAVFPWSGAVKSPGLLMAEKQTGLYAPSPVVVAELAGQNQSVKAGDIVARLKSPELEEEAANAARAASLMREKLAAMSLNAAARDTYLVDWQDYQGLLSDQMLYTERLSRLTLTAPFDGRVVDVPKWARPGQWVTPNERLGLLISHSTVVAAYVGETDLSRLKVGDQGFFEPAGRRDDRLRLTIVAIDASATTDLPYPELASSYGGPIGIQHTTERKLTPETAMYKIICRVDRGPDEGALPEQSLIGTAVLKGRPKSLIATIWQNTLGIIIRESGL